MGINYLLLIVSGTICLTGIYKLYNGKRKFNNLTILATGVVFILVLSATLMHIPYHDFKIIIQRY